MSFPTKPAFVVFANGWEESRAHPCMAWMEKYTKKFDTREINDENQAEYNTADYTYTKADGTTATGGLPAHQLAMATYAPFSAYSHVPKMLACWETENGWYMTGQATLFADLPVPGGEKTKADLTGRKWDLEMEAMFQFEYVKAADGIDGIKMKSTKAFSDSTPAVVEMLKRGMIKPEQLLG